MGRNESGMRRGRYGGRKEEGRLKQGRRKELGYMRRFKIGGKSGEKGKVWTVEN